MVKTLINSYDAYEDLMEKAKKGLDFYKKLQNNVSRLLSRIKSVTKVQDEERTQRAEAELRKSNFNFLFLTFNYFWFKISAEA